MDDLQTLIDSLPVPGVDEMPPMVELSEKDRIYAAEEKKISDALLDPKNDTEKRVKYVLESLCGMRLKKDGDWRVSASGQQFFAKKVADYVGSTPGNDRNYHTYVEVKGISPGKNFAFIRLDQTNTNGQPSQFEKLTEAWEHGNLVFLALGWWIGSNGKYIVEERGKKKFTRWYRDTLKLEFALIPWNRWVVHTKITKRRSLTYTTLGNEFQDCMIYKTGNRWHFTPGHWWERRYEVENPMFGTKLIVG